MCIAGVIDENRDVDVAEFLYEHGFVNVRALRTRSSHIKRYYSRLDLLSNLVANLLNLFRSGV